MTMYTIHAQIEVTFDSLSKGFPDVVKGKGDRYILSRPERHRNGDSKPMRR